MQNLIDVRKDEGKLKEINFYLNLLILFLMGLTIFSYQIALNPKYLNRSKLRINWLTVGLISNLIVGGISKVKLPKLENQIEELEKDSLIFEENNRKLILSFANNYLENNLTNQIFPQKEETDPFLQSLLTQIYSAPLKGEEVTDVSQSREASPSEQLPE